MSNAATASLLRARPGSRWFLAALAADAVGTVAAVVFGLFWFGHVKGHCGVVRFYEQAFGVLVLGGWFAGTAVGVGLAVVGMVRNLRTVAAGAVVAVLVNLAMAIVCVATVHRVRSADYGLKSTAQLLEFLAGDEPVAQRLAAHALGERRAVEALEPLCALLDDAGQDVNLRHSAAIALGRICEREPGQGPAPQRAVEALSGALADPDEFLPCTAADALAGIRDTRAVAPLADVLADAGRPSHVRESAARALGAIGGEDGRGALTACLASGPEEELARTVTRALQASRHAGAAGLPAD